MVTLRDAVNLARADNGLAVVSTLRSDQTIQVAGAAARINHDCS